MRQRGVGRALIDLIICVTEAGCFDANKYLARLRDWNRDIILKVVILVVLRLDISTNYSTHGCLQLIYLGELQSLHLFGDQIVGHLVI